MEKLDNEVRVIAEFGDVSDGTSYVEHGMAREIMRLREIVERTEWEREQAWQVTQQQERILAALREEKDSMRPSVFDNLFRTEQERDSALRTLAALREPSEAVTKAAVLNYGGDLTDAIRAAVAAAEQEVSA